MRIRNQIQLFIAVAFLGIFLLPIVWLYLTAFKDRVEIFSTPPTTLSSPTFDNFRITFLEKEFSSALLNSILVSSLSTIIGLVISTIAAYGFSRRKTLGKENLFFFLFSLMILPPIVIAFPLFMVASRVGVNDNYLFLILVYLGILIPFGTILLKAFFDKIPTSLEDSAKIDGIPFWYYFIRIFIREARMPIAITSFFLFLTSWNEFLFAMIFATGDNTTLPVSTLGLITPIGTYWGQIAAVAVVTSFPIIILSFIFRRYLLAGFTFGIYTE